MLYALYVFSERREDSKMGKIKNNSQGRQRNPIRTFQAILISLVLVAFDRYSRLR